MVERAVVYLGLVLLMISFLLEQPMRYAIGP